MSEKFKKALRIAVNVGCGFEGDAEDAAELLTLITGLESRIAELEAESERFTAHSDIERQDDKSSNDTQTQTIVYGKESEACGGDGTLLLVDNYKGQATATVDCPYCNCTGYVKECE